MWRLERQAYVVVAALSPRKIWFSIVGYTITQIQVNETLIGYAGLLGHVLKIRYDVVTHSDGDLALELRSVRILPRLQFRKIIFLFHHIGPL